MTRKLMVFGFAALLFASFQVETLKAFEPPVAKGRKIKAKASEEDGGGGAKAGPSDKEKGDKKGASATGLNKGPNEKTRYEFDSESARNQVSFTSKAPGETIKGTAKKIEGWLELNPRNVAEGATGEIKVPWSDVSTGNKMRDSHMRDPSHGWVDAATHPEIVFKVTGVEESNLQKKNTKATLFKTKLVGTMSLNGRDVEMTIPVTLSYVAKTNKTKEALGIKGSFKIPLKDFGIEGKPGAIGSKVAAEQDIKVSVVLARAGGEDVPSDAPKPTPKGKPKPRPRGI